MAFMPEVAAAGWDTLLAWWSNPPSHLGPRALVLEEVATELRRRRPDEGAERLSADVGSDDGERVAAALLGLTLMPEHDRFTPEASAAMHRALAHHDPAVVAAAVDGLRHLRDHRQEAAVRALANHVDPAVRAAVIRYRAALDGAAAAGALRVGLEDPDPVVRDNAEEALQELGLTTP